MPYQGKREFGVQLVLPRTERFCAVRYHGVTTSHPGSVPRADGDDTLEPVERYERVGPRAIAGSRAGPARDILITTAGLGTQGRLVVSDYRVKPDREQNIVGA